jgi:glucosamine-6-phosphate deaminase
MKVEILPTAAALGRRAAELGGDAIRAATSEQGAARIVVATGASQFEVFRSLLAREDIDWPRVSGFHLDEYIGLPPTHAASFRKYLKERFVDHVPLRDFHFVQGDAADPHEECRRIGALISEHAVDVLFCGIGENGHLAFNDPPADFETDLPYIVVQLDEACRRQQLGEGWFAALDDIPKRAISMSIRQIMKAKRIICSVPDERKAAAVRATVEGPITPHIPASILRQHAQVHLLLDESSAVQLSSGSSP